MGDVNTWPQALKSQCTEQCADCMQPGSWSIANNSDVPVSSRHSDMGQTGTSWSDMVPTLFGMARPDPASGSDEGSGQ